MKSRRLNKITAAFNHNVVACCKKFSGVHDVTNFESFSISETSNRLRLWSVVIYCSCKNLWLLRVHCAWPVDATSSKKKRNAWICGLYRDFREKFSSETTNSWFWLLMIRKSKLYAIKLYKFSFYKFGYQKRMPYHCSGSLNLIRTSVWTAICSVKLLAKTHKLQ